MLVHGAWHGGWCWDPVRTPLEAEGHRVFTPTLKGLAERADELSAEVSLEDHIEDVLTVIRDNDLSDIVLCGHSYGGMIITAVADRLKPRIGHIVYLDAALPEDGETMVSYGEPRPRAVVEAAEQAMREIAPDGVGMMVFPPALLGVPPDQPRHGWVEAKLTPHPLKTWLDPISLANGGPAGLPRTYVHCIDPVLAQTQFGWLYSQFKDDPEWNAVTLATGHDAMITDPAGVAQILLKAAHAPAGSKETEKKG
ncbi:MAG: alpha/beta fold hydrolase [Erythrobacter sp.]|uniref:alpha/beta fold hydrolase n=1 Tax=Erythrobacter sp. TaxID=1042 RepID=UPI00260316EC|nr:alpha/beta fold hydrolase [Erythrobacter sp.]MDJ0977626.1 alpha/beta fold hydrolase [Erythrobacter sp.]